MRKIYTYAGLYLLTFVCLLPAKIKAQFTPGKLAVVQIGNGNTLTSAAFPVRVVQYNTSGTLQTGTTITIFPSTATTGAGIPRALTQSGTATSEGDISLSADGRYLVLVGYNATTGTANVSSGTAEAVIASVSSTGSFNTLTSLTRSKSFPGGSIRSAASLDGSTFWAAGAGNSTTGSIRYAILGNTNDSGLQISKTVSSARVVNIANGQMYASASSGSFRLVTVGTGVPVTSGQVMTNLPGFPTTAYDPYAYTFLDLNSNVPGVDVLYVANLGTASVGGLYKYSLVNNSWVANGYLGGNIRGVTGLVNCGGYAELYMTTSLNASSKPTRLNAFTDSTGYNVSIGNGQKKLSNTVLLATAAAKYAFGGVAFTPLTNTQKPDLTNFNISAQGLCDVRDNTVQLYAPSLANGNYDINYSLSNANTADNISVQVSVNNGYGSFTIPAALIPNSGNTIITINSVSNNLGCSINSNAQTAFFISNVSAEVSADSISCYGGTTFVNIIPSGGLSSYSIFGSSQTVGAGDYSYNITDVQSCSTNVSISIRQPDSITLSVAKTNVLCNGGSTGSITVTVSGGTPPYQYSINNGTSFSNSNVFTGLKAGNYTVLVKDNNGCTKAASVVTTITQPTVLSGQYCYNPTAPNAKILGTRGKGGTPPYTYSGDGITYKPGNVLNGTAYAFFNKTPGSYTIYIKDANNCVSIKTVNTSTLPVCPTSSLFADAAPEEVLAKSSLSVTLLPNPTSSKFTAIINNYKDEAVVIKATDLFGKVVFITTAKNSSAISFGEKFIPGTYIIEFIHGNERKIITAIKQ